ncbi:hypothetical protein [Spiroplasma endosymbiont of Nebria brevicollis]|uniref:hypothetical protein n=1 Tax=Spiroplasma endosymbiont of Nebria brevicollis TaxID=3066284 RepID=UPI00313E1C32
MFKTQLVNIEKDKIIPDKNNQGKTLNFDVLTFLEINKQTNFPTGKVRDKWYNPLVVNDFSKYLHKLTLKVGNYYNLVLDLSGTIVDITEWK